MDWINLDNWPRKRHFEMFNKLDMPHFNITADLDVTEALNFCKDHKISSFAFILYLISRTSNEIENLRYRIRNERVCLHKRVDPAFTVLGEDQLYYHCRTQWQPDLLAFCDQVKADIEHSKKHKILHTDKTDDDVIFLSCIPWVSFTGISHAMHFSPVDSIPRYYWGKYKTTQQRTLMPFSVQVHHGVADGLHVGQQFEAMQYLLQNPDTLSVN